MGRGLGRPSTVGRVVSALAAVAAVAGIWLASANAQDIPAQRRTKGAVAAGVTPMNTALAQAYQNNPQLNAQRAATRAVDENVAIALGGYRPRVTATGSLTETHLETYTKSPPTNVCTSTNCGNVGAASYGITATQTLFNGFQTGNRTRQAELQVFAARETLRSAEQSVLLNAATAYMNLLRDTAHPRPAAQQRHRARGDTAADARSFQRRRSDAHRRGAGGIAAGRRPVVVADRRVQLHHVARGLSAGDRCRGRGGW